MVVCWDVFLQVERSYSQNRDVDLHPGAERAGGVRRRGASPGQGRQHRRRLSAQTGTRFASACFMLSPCPTVTDIFWDSLVLASLFPNSSPSPLSSSPVPAGSHSWHPLPHRIAPPPLQGHSRRVHITVKPVQHSGTLPLMVEAVLSISIGCITARSTKLQRGLDSYQVRPAGLKLCLTKIG